MNIPGLDAHYGDQPEPDEPCDACAFTDTHCGDCEQCCASVEDHPEIHPDPEPDCHKCTLVALTRVSLRVVELEARIRETEAVVRVCSFTPDHPDIEVVPVANVLAALDGDA